MHEKGVELKIELFHVVIVAIKMEIVYMYNIAPS